MNKRNVKNVQLATSTSQPKTQVVKDVFMIPVCCPICKKSKQIDMDTLWHKSGNNTFINIRCATQTCTRKRLGTWTRQIGSDNTTIQEWMQHNGQCQKHTERPASITQTLYLTQSIKDDTKERNINLKRKEKATTQQTATKKQKKE